MAEVVDYGRVQAELGGKGLRCLYHNSGSWGFGDPTKVRAVGWILADDVTLRPGAREVARVLDGIDELVTGVMSTWERVGGDLWLLPGSHWAYELDFGTPAMEAVLHRWGVKGAEGLVGRNDGSAVRFGLSGGVDGVDEAAAAGILKELLGCGTTSDYQIVFPSLPLTGIAHHHVQVWWQTEDTELAGWLSGFGKSL